MQLMAEKTRMIRVADEFADCILQLQSRIEKKTGVKPSSVQLSKRIATCIIWGEKLKVEEEANDFTRF
jgi:hypothetical protein